MNRFNIQYNIQVPKRYQREWDRVVISSCCVWQNWTELSQQNSHSLLKCVYGSSQSRDNELDVCLQTRFVLGGGRHILAPLSQRTPNDTRNKSFVTVRKGSLEVRETHASLRALCRSTIGIYSRASSQSLAQNVVGSVDGDVWSLLRESTNHRSLFDSNRYNALYLKRNWEKVRVEPNVASEA
jgi:hypothetical protein